MIPSSLVRDAEGVLCAREEIDARYPDTGASEMMRVEETSFWFSHRNEVVAIVLDRFAPGAEVWDVGGGNGYQAKMLQDRGRSVVVVEPGVVGCRNAARRGVKTVIRASLESLHLPESSLGAITLLDVIEHLPDPVSTLSECRRVLRADGRIVIAVPAFESLWSTEDDYAEHQRRYTMRMLRDHVDRAGMHVLWSSFYFAPLLAPIFLVRALPYKLGIGKGKPAEPDLSHHGKGGIAQRAVEALLAREREKLRAGKTLRIGSSIVAVISR
jgi:SAM-dependent methyltransferase